MPAVPAAAGLVFGWPAPAAVRIEKRGEKRGSKVSMRYRLDVQPDVEQSIRIRQHDFEFLEVNGQDATTTEMKAQMAQALALTQAVPDIMVDRTGAYLRIDGIEAVIERVAALQSQNKGMSPAESERLRKAMSSPAAVATLQEACGADWQAWVGAWVGFDIPPGEQREVDGMLPVLGASVPAKVTRRHHGEVAEHPGHVRLSITSRIEGDEGSKAFLAAMNDMAAKLGGRPFPAGELVSVRAETLLEVVIDPKTLRPLQAKRHKDLRLVLKGKEAREENERHEFSFVFEPAPVAK